MYRTARLTLFFVGGVIGAQLLIAKFSSDTLFTSFNRKACDDQAPFKVLEDKLPTSGKPSYNPRTELCVYSYTDKDGKPAQITWNP